MIINNMPRKHGGEHWVACCKKSGSEDLYVFDSFGRPTEDLIPSLKGNGSGSRRLPRTIVDADYDKDQTQNQKDCGARCIAWIKLFDEHGADSALLI